MISRVVDKKTYDRLKEKAKSIFKPIKRRRGGKTQRIEAIEIDLNVKIGDSKQLRRRMKKAGIEPPSYPNAAHHIVAGDAPDAINARNHMEKYGVSINSHHNGVFLRTTEEGEGVLHKGPHTGKYYAEVNKRILQANSKEQVLEILDDIREGLIDGTFSW